MLTSGWRVLALDGEPGTRDRVLATTQGTAQERLTIETIHFPDLIPTGGGLGVAGYSLPYIHPDDFAGVWDLIRSSLACVPAHGSPATSSARETRGPTTRMRPSSARRPHVLCSREWRSCRSTRRTRTARRTAAPNTGMCSMSSLVRRACRADPRPPHSLSLPMTLSDTSHGPHQDPYRCNRDRLSRCRSATGGLAKTLSRGLLGHTEHGRDLRPSSTISPGLRDLIGQDQVVNGDCAKRLTDGIQIRSIRIWRRERLGVEAVEPRFGVGEGLLELFTGSWHVDHLR
jgi:hypothetical protein